MIQWLSGSTRHVVWSVAAIAFVACVGVQASAPPGRTDAPAAAGAGSAAPTASRMTPEQQVLEGRLLVIHHGCGDCHGGTDNVAAPGWLAGWRPEFPPDVGRYQIGPFTTYARNLTPDNATGLGRFSERQIFNALRFGLRPGETPDVEITSGIPGQGNFPVTPKYLAPPMPWNVFRHMSDEELRAIAAYLKRGLRPVSHRVPDSEGPPDFWASTWAEIAGTYPAPAFPTANEAVSR
jgi:mono/diheme cytochrome c family protein